VHGLSLPKNHEFTPTLMIYYTTTIALIEKALKALKDDPSRSITKIAKEYSINCSTLSRRSRGITNS
jgi:hypothetical protein